MWTLYPISEFCKREKHASHLYINDCQSTVRWGRTRAFQRKTLFHQLVTIQKSVLEVLTLSCTDVHVFFIAPQTNKYFSRKIEMICVSLPLIRGRSLEYCKKFYTTELMCRNEHQCCRQNINNTYDYIRLNKFGMRKLCLINCGSHCYGNNMHANWY